MHSNKMSKALIHYDSVQELFIHNFTLRCCSYLDRTNNMDPYFGKWRSEVITGSASLAKPHGAS